MSVVSKKCTCRSGTIVSWPKAMQPYFGYLSCGFNAKHSDFDVAKLNRF